MALDIPLCRTIKGQKSMSFLDAKFWNMLRSNIKAAATTASSRTAWKKKFKIAKVKKIFSSEEP